jgi:hypothetical protein
MSLRATLYETLMPAKAPHEDLFTYLGSAAQSEGWSGRHIRGNLELSSRIAQSIQATQIHHIYAEPQELDVIFAKPSEKTPCMFPRTPQAAVVMSAHCGVTKTHMTPYFTQLHDAMGNNTFPQGLTSEKLLGNVLHEFSQMTAFIEASRWNAALIVRTVAI